MDTYMCMFKCMCCFKLSDKFIAKEIEFVDKITLFFVDTVSRFLMFGDFYLFINAIYVYRNHG